MFIIQALTARVQITRLSPMAVTFSRQQQRNGIFKVFSIILMISKNFFLASLHVITGHEMR